MCLRFAACAAWGLRGLEGCASRVCEGRDADVGCRLDLPALDLQRGRRSSAVYASHGASPESVSIAPTSQSGLTALAGIPSRARIAVGCEDSYSCSETKSKNEVTPEQHAEFYRFVSQSFDDPRYTLHFSADAPVSIRAIFYVPQTHMEKWGMARQDFGVNLYSRKVLIQSKGNPLPCLALSCLYLPSVPRRTLLCPTYRSFCTSPYLALSGHRC